MLCSECFSNKKHNCATAIKHLKSLNKILLKIWSYLEQSFNKKALHNKETNDLFC